MVYNKETGTGLIGVLLIIVAGWLLGTPQDPEWLEFVGMGCLAGGLLIEIRLLDRFQYRLTVIEQKLGIRYQ